MSDKTTTAPAPFDPLLSEKQVRELTTLSHNEIHKRRRAGTFPEPEPIGGRRVAYRQSAIAAWLSDPTGWTKDKHAGAQAA